MLYATGCKEKKKATSVKKRYMLLIREKGCPFMQDAMLPLFSY